MGKQNWVFLALLAGGLSLSGRALASDPFQYIPAAKAAADVADSAKGPATKIYFSHDNFQGLMSGRSRSGQAELHMHWNDYITVVSGVATLTVGGNGVNMKEVSPGELRGDRIEGGRTVTLHPGDIVTIPAGMPHWMQLAPGMKFLYSVSKTRE